MAVKIITCPWCGKEARITYEEDRVYQMKCYECQNTMLHVDHSFDSAAEFFEHLANLLQAEKDGRLWTLAVSPWLTPVTSNAVYIVDDGEVYDDFVTGVEIGIGPNGNIVCLYETFDGDGFYDSDIGKTVFLTREGAEAALSGKGGDS